MAVRGRLEPADAADVGAGLVPYGVAVWHRLGSLSWSKLTGPADVADVRGGAGVACASHEAGASPLLCRGAEFQWVGLFGRIPSHPAEAFRFAAVWRLDLSCFRFGGGVKAGSGTGLLPALQRGGRWACDAGAALRCFAVTADPFCDVPCRSSPLRSSGCGVFVGAAFLAVRVPTFCSLRSVSCRIVLGAYRPLLQRVSSRCSCCAVFSGCLAAWIPAATLPLIYDFPVLASSGCLHLAAPRCVPPLPAATPLPLAHALQLPAAPPLPIALVSQLLTAMPPSAAFVLQLLAATSPGDRFCRITGVCSKNNECWTDSGMLRRCSKAYLRVSSQIT